MKVQRQKRHVYVLSGEGKFWTLKTLGGALVFRIWRRGPIGARKTIAIQSAANFLEDAAEMLGQLSELRIRRENGTFAPARTYPKSSDPRRTRG